MARPFVKLDQRPITHLLPEMNDRLNKVRDEFLAAGKGLKALAVRYKVPWPTIEAYGKAEGWFFTERERTQELRKVALKKFDAQFKERWGTPDQAITFAVSRLLDLLGDSEYKMATPASLGQAVAALMKIKELLEGRATERVVSDNGICYPDEFYVACANLRKLAVIEEMFPQDASEFQKQIDLWYAKAQVDKTGQFRAWALANRLEGDPTLAPEPERGVFTASPPVPKEETEVARIQAGAAQNV